MIVKVTLNKKKGKGVKVIEVEVGCVTDKDNDEHLKSCALNRRKILLKERHEWFIVKKEIIKQRPLLNDTNGGLGIE